MPFSKFADCACMLPTEGTLMVVLAAGAVTSDFIHFFKELWHQSILYPLISAVFART
jgi:hypothetical protein